MKNTNQYILKYEKRIPSIAPKSLNELDVKLNIFKDNNIECWYAPLGVINSKAKIVLYGVTPGWSQMKVAYKIHINNKVNAKNKTPLSDIAFHGGMKTNLLGMLDELRVHTHLINCNSISDAFKSKNFAYGSVLKYPVFYYRQKKLNNYNGHSSNMLKNKSLKNMLETILVEELRMLNKCLIIPFGPKAYDAIHHVTNKFKINKHTVLSGFPHPSPASPYRIPRFNDNKARLTKEICNWFS